MDTDTKTNFPSHVQARLENNELYRLTPGVLDLYNTFDDEKGVQLAQLVYKLFTKEVPLSDFPQVLANSLGIGIDIATGIAYEYTRRVFGDLGDYYTDVDSLLNNWSATKSAPPNAPNADLEMWDAGKFPDGEIDEADEEMEDYPEDDLEMEAEVSQDAEGEEENVEIAEPPVDSSANLPRFTDNITKNAPRIADLLVNDSSGNKLLPIREALELNPKIGEIMLTSNALKIVGMDNLQRPTIRNWIKDYETSMGRNNHDTQARNNYLATYPNPLELDDEEKIKLALVLKSYDENKQIKFDEDWQIVFASDNEPENEQPSEIDNEDVSEILDEAEVGLPRDQEIPLSPDNNVGDQSVENINENEDVAMDQGISTVGNSEEGGSPPENKEFSHYSFQKQPNLNNKPTEESQPNNEDNPSGTEVVKDISFPSTPSLGNESDLQPLSENKPGVGNYGLATSINSNDQNGPLTKEELHHIFDE